MSDTPDTLLLLDAPSLYFRAFHGIPETITDSAGRPVNAIRGFIDMLAHLLATRRPARVVATLDNDWRPQFRVDAVAAYKAHRLAPDGGELTPETLVPQVPVIRAVLDAVGIACFGVDGYEADDVIGTLATAYAGPTEIVTGDRDLFQLVDDTKPVRILYTAKGVRDLDVVDESRLREKYGIPGRSYADFALLRGDPSDGLPGVAGIGEKTAAGLLARFGSLDAVIEALDGDGGDALSPAVRRRLTDGRDYIAAARPVVWVARDVPVPTYDDHVPAAPRDPERLVDLADEWNLDSPLSRLLAALPAS